MKQKLKGRKVSPSVNKKNKGGGLTEGSEKRNINSNVPFMKSGLPPSPVKKQSVAEMLTFEMDRGLELLIQSCEKYCKDMDTKAVPLLLLREYKRILIENYMKGVKENTELNKK